MHLLPNVRERLAQSFSGEFAVHQQHVAHTGRVPFQRVKGVSVNSLDQSHPVRTQQHVRVMRVKHQLPASKTQEAHSNVDCTHLISEYDVGRLTVDEHHQTHPKHPDGRQKDRESSKYLSRNPLPVHCYLPTRWMITKGSRRAHTLRVPSVVSLKARLGSWCAVYIRTRYPQAFSPEAAFTTRFSAPPMPRSR